MPKSDPRETRPSRDELAVPQALAGRKVARVLEKMRPGWRFPELRRLSRKGRLRLNGRRCRLDDRTEWGDRISLPSAPPIPRSPVVAFEIRLELPTLLIVDKPRGIPVQPGPGHRNTALLCGLLHRFPGLLKLGPQRSHGLVHRIDSETSGLLAVARDAGTHAALSKAFASRSVRKGYLALVHGFPSAQGTIDLRLAEHRAGSHLRAVVSRRGKSATTHFRVLGAGHGFSLLAVSTAGGRFHQIRAHMAHAGHPLAGDPLYGSRDRSRWLVEEAGLRRLFLHAAFLGLPELPDVPAQNLHSGLPPELLRVLDAMDIPSCYVDDSWKSMSPRHNSLENPGS